MEISLYYDPQGNRPKELILFYESARSTIYSQGVLRQDYLGIKATRHQRSIWTGSKDKTVLDLTTIHNSAARTKGGLTPH